jgi:protein transport protein SEC23
VIVFHGETIAAWRDQRYQDSDEHVHFRTLLHQPLEDANAIMDARFPVPRYIIADQHKSEARFLICKLNPSVTHNSTDVHAGQVIPTDDVSLKVFMEHLMKLAVES